MSKQKVDPLSQRNGSFAASREVWKYISDSGISTVSLMMMMMMTMMMMMMMMTMTMTMTISVYQFIYLAKAQLINVIESS